MTTFTLTINTNDTATITSILDALGKPIGDAPVHTVAEPTFNPCKPFEPTFGKGDRVLYARPDGTYFIGTVESVEDKAGEFPVIRIRKDSNDKVTKLYGHIEGTFHKL